MGMSNNFLSQEEINALLSGESTDSEDSNVSSSGSENMEDAITETDKDLLGKWSVFVFYPADFTFVCPTELGDLADNYEKFKEAGCEVYSVSTDTHFVHKAWADASDTIAKIQYPMLADPTGRLAIRNKGRGKNF